MRRIELPITEPSLFVPNLPRQAVAPLVVDMWCLKSMPVCIVLGDTISEAEELGEDITALAEALTPSVEYEFLLFDDPPTTDHPDFHERVCDRLSVLSSLKSVEKPIYSNKKWVIATTLEAILASCPIVEEQSKTEIILTSGDLYSFEKLTKKLGGTLDYSCEIICEEPGQFSIRGGLIDVFPVNQTHPVRVDFFGDEVEEIRVFDPSTQRTTGIVEEVRISSLHHDESAERKGEFFRHLPNSIFWFSPEPENFLQLHPIALHEASNPAAVQANFSLSWNRKNKLNDFHLATSEIDAGSGVFENSPQQILQVAPLVDPLSDHDCTGSDLSIIRRDSAKFLRDLKKRKDSNYDVILAIGAEAEKERIFSILSQAEIFDFKPRVIQVGLRDGFVYESENGATSFSNWIQDGAKGLVVATAREILGRERSRRPMRSRKAKVYRREVDQALDFSELVQGDHLVHLQHGICIFDCLGKIEHEGTNEEAITVEFADGILLHVPLQESHLLSRYVGLKRAKPKLAKLGGKAWSNAKRNAEIAAMDLAADLLRLQATRDSEHGHAFSMDDQWQKEFEDSFPYTETPDQLRAIGEMKVDMESEKPMDRLVCGDVGYGKTEVAMRAAFKAVMDGKQVAILSPTTILCQQHFQSFSERMVDFPVSIEMLSRFRTKGQQKKILTRLKEGTVDILIGTHRLLGRDVSFKELGLIVIDEEQRFGVEHKENLKRLRAKVDVLTLSATPIPRTLYFAMVGARSFSAIETAPSDRRPIRTEVVRDSQETVRRAIETEVRRGGQIFYLHNRVKTINSVAKKLRLNFPSLTVCVGHGQMPEGELEKVMTEFVAGKMDVLVCTTIIESGLDIPNCNTIIIDGADKFGLSQLYQLRGRVGRFSRQAYAYLMVNHGAPVTEKARKRLSALKQSKSMGAGFRIALRDLELRGAGNLLGSEQSGHVAGVGFEMYCRLLKESVSRLKGEEHSLRPIATVKLDFTTNFNEMDESCKDEDLFINSFLPESYITEPRLRIEAYRKLANFLSTDEIKDYAEELNDRFGKIPDSVSALLMETEIRCLAEEAGFDKVEVIKGKLYLRFVQRGPNNEAKFVRKVGKIPLLLAKSTILQLKEIISFLKIYIHGNSFQKN